MSNPTVFLSYSWDSDSHRQWVLGLAQRLEDHGIKVILDKSDAKLTDQVPHFMERAVEDSDFVLVICTPNYRVRWLRKIRSTILSTPCPSKVREGKSLIL
ncbi:MAG: toll/interleukin-1 receptor domain-containing protein [Armatimonadetes bacterium]|nr:toll/interleukin-1 receptor domain-containing protein [Armatimonadota bacterium]